MRWGVPRCEVLIAVGDQRRERVHMVRVLYHWNLIRLRGRGNRQERKRENNNINIRLRFFFQLPLWRLWVRAAIELWVLWRCQNLGATAKTQWFRN